MYWSSVLSSIFFTCFRLFWYDDFFIIILLLWIWSRPAPVSVCILSALISISHCLMLLDLHLKARTFCDVMPATFQSKILLLVSKLTTNLLELCIHDEYLLGKFEIKLNLELGWLCSFRVRRMISKRKLRNSLGT